MRENQSNESEFKHQQKLVSADMDPTQIKLEFNLLQRKYDILEEKEAQLQKLCSIYSKKNNNKELVDILKEITKILNSKPKK